MSSAHEVHHELDPLQPVATELASRTRCAGCCLYKAMRIVDIAMLLFGVGVLVYSLWLEKKWEVGIADLPSGSSPPDLPRFVHACFGIGIAVCLSTIFGHVLANCISNCTLFLYIVIIGCLLLLEVSVIIFTFFKMDRKAQITSYFGEERKGFQSFVMFHVYTCRIIILLIWVAQVNVVVLGAILCLLGIESITHCEMEMEMEMEMDAPVFTQSFFVPDPPPGSHNYPRRCSSIFLRPNRPPNLFLYFWGVFRMQFQTRNITIF